MFSHFFCLRSFWWCTTSVVFSNSYPPGLTVGTLSVSLHTTQTIPTDIRQTTWQYLAKYLPAKHKQRLFLEFFHLTEQRWHRTKDICCLEVRTEIFSFSARIRCNNIWKVLINWCWDEIWLAMLEQLARIESRKVKQRLL